MKNRIFQKTWLLFKPRNYSSPTDAYYLRVCNDVKKRLLKWSDVPLFMENLSEGDLDQLCCFLVCYFEDIISQTNLWRTFTRKHEELYGKKIPFYNAKDYLEDEINKEDVSFLIWYYLNTINGERFIHPYHLLLIDASAKVMEVLDEEYEYAPENTSLKSYYVIPETEKDFYRTRMVMDNILLKSYLFMDAQTSLRDKEEEIVKSKNRETLLNYLNENRDGFLHSYCTSLLGFRAKEWAAYLLGKDHPLYNDLLAISEKISGTFFYKSQDATHIHLEHIASEKVFKLTKASFDHGDNLDEKDLIIYISIIQWRKEWWFSGVFVKLGFNADLILDEKNSMESRRSVAFLDQDTSHLKESIQLHYRAFLKFNNNSMVAFLPSAKINSFIAEYVQYYNQSLNKPQQDHDEAVKHARAKGFRFGEDKQKVDFESMSSSGLIFFNIKTGVPEIAIDINSAFPDEENPFFDAQKSDAHLWHLLTAEYFSADLAFYCLNRYKEKLPFFKNPSNKYFLKDIDFLLRFWKKGNFYSKTGLTSI